MSLKWLVSALRALFAEVSIWVCLGIFICAKFLFSFFVFVEEVGFADFCGTIMCFDHICFYEGV